MGRLDRAGDERVGWPELGVATAAPWPVMAGVRGVRDLGHEKENRKHRGAQKLVANSPEARTATKKGRLGLATTNGGRRLCKEVRRRLGTRWKQRNANETTRRLRKSEEKVGKSLTAAETRHSGELLVMWISAADSGEIVAAAEARGKLVE
jgi:hypothetical protein